MFHDVILKKNARIYGESTLSKGWSINTLERKRITFERCCVNLISMKTKDIWQFLQHFTALPLATVKRALNTVRWNSAISVMQPLYWVTRNINKDELYIHIAKIIY